MPLSVRPCLETLVHADTVFCAVGSSSDHWDHLLLVDSAGESQFDALNRLVRKHSHLSEELLCVAGVGTDFHGFRGRPWVSARGNLHLSVLLSPNRQIERAGIAFTVLAVVSILQALDELGSLAKRPGVKWVNDILMGDAKIGGVLANAQIQQNIVRHAVVGIGLNIENVPEVPPTPFVPRVGSLQQYSSDQDRCTLPLVFQKLIMYLGANYRSLVSGGLPQLLEVYRSRSLVLGRSVRIHRDTKNDPRNQLISGVVSSIGDNLELHLEGIPAPVTTGRLELLSH
jgi:BirA family biotin operon repressor/biotin-[acetyl-CoA-carboxylase] ligase